MTDKSVGIMGGMGPEATVDLMQRIIAGTPAKDDVDHLHLLVDNNPKVPSRIKALLEGNGEDPTPALIKMAQGLQSAGAEFLAMPCNTAHNYHSAIAESVSIPVINLIDLTVETVHQKQPSIVKVGVLASSAVLKTELYHPYFARKNIETLFPSEEHQASVMQLIQSIKAKAATEAEFEAYQLALSNLQAQGAEALIIACTELSVVAQQINSHLPVYDASQLLADTIISMAKQS